MVSLPKLYPLGIPTRPPCVTGRTQAMGVREPIRSRAQFGRIIGALERDAVAFWKMEEEGGLRYDSTGNERHLLDNNTVGYSASGKFGNAASLTASAAEYLSNTDADGVFSHYDGSSNRSISMSFWVKFDSLADGRAPISRDNGGTDRDWACLLRSDDKIDFIVMGNLFLNDRVAHSDVECSTGEWYHVYCGWDNDQEKSFISVNGEQIQYSAISYTPSNDPAANFHLGRQGSTTYHDGDIDHVGFWHRLLTPAEQSYLANGGRLFADDLLAGIESKAIASYKFQEDPDGGLIYDYSGNDYHIDTFFNSPTRDDGLNGKALKLTQASAQYCEESGATGLRTSLTGTHSFTCWFKTGTAMPTVPGIFYAGNGSGSDYQITLYGNLATNQWVVATRGNNQIAQVTLTMSAAEESGGEWVFIYGELDADGTGATIRASKNGGAISEGSNASWLTPGASHLEVGRHIQLAGREFDGLIDNLNFYNAPLTDAEIALMYNDGNGRSLFDSITEKLAADAVAYWPLGVNGDDATGNGHDATMIGTVTHAAGKVGNLAELGGTPNHYEIPDSNDLDPQANGTGIISFCGWVQPSAYNDTAIISKDKNPTDGSYAYKLRQESGSTLRLYSYGTSGLRLVDIGSGLGASQLYFFYFYVDTVTGEIGGSVDGGTIQTTSGALNHTANSNPLWFGQDDWDQGATCDLDEVSCFNRKLTDAEIATLYNGGDGLALIPDYAASLRTAALGYYPLGADGADVSGNGNDCTPQNDPTFGATGKDGNGVDLETDYDQYLSLANASATDLLFGDEDFAISFWVKREAGSITQDIVSVYNATGDNRSYLVRLDTSDRLVFIVSSDGTSGNATTITRTGALSSGTWYFVVAQYNSGQNQMELYVDAADPDTASHSGGAYASTTADFLIGAEAAGDATFDGVIDELAVYGEMLTVGEIDFLYNGGTGRALWPDAIASMQSAALGYYPLGVNGDDVSGNGNDTTEQNGPLTYATGKVGDAVDLVAASSQTLDLANASAGDYLFGDVASSGHVWVYRDSSQNADICGIRGGVGNKSWLIYTNTSNRYRVELSSDGTATTDAITTVVAQTAAWDCVQWYYDPVANLFGLRVNGGSWVTMSHSGGMYASSSTDFRIGTNNAGSYFDGKIDDLVICSGRLTDFEFDTLYNSGNGRALFPDYATDIEAKAVGYWKFEDATDETANAFDLTENNTPTYVSGKLGNAVNLVAASSQNLEHADDDAFSFGSTPWEMCGWVSYDIAGDVFAKWNAAGTEEYILIVSGTSFIFYMENNADTQVLVQSTGLSTGTWYFVRCGWDGANVFIERDRGTPVTSALSAPLRSSTSPLYFGKRGSGGTNFDGQLDTFYLGPLLTDAEADFLYNAGNGREVFK